MGVGDREGCVGTGGVSSKFELLHAWTANRAATRAVARIVDLGGISYSNPKAWKISMNWPAFPGWYQGDLVDNDADVVQDVYGTPAVPVIADGVVGPGYLSVQITGHREWATSHGLAEPRVRLNRARAYRYDVGAQPGNGSVLPLQ